VQVVKNAQKVMINITIVKFAQISARNLKNEGARSSVYMLYNFLTLTQTD